MLYETFIHTEFLSDVTVCDELVDFFNQSNTKVPGTSRNSYTGNPELNNSVKESTDCAIDPDHPATVRYWGELKKIVDAYIAKFPHCNSYAPWATVETPNIQYYPPGGGFKIWHTERAAAHIPQTFRHLVFMTYLNDVTDGGETEFFHQKLMVQPRKGLTIIWPADWTHTHRGVPSMTQEKIIITGWFSFT